jgi:hypothetical protein
MIIPLYKRDGLDFQPQDGKTSEGQFAIIAFVSWCAAPGLFTNNHPVTPAPIKTLLCLCFFPPRAKKNKPSAPRVVGDSDLLSIPKYSSMISAYSQNT